ncbi:flavodoxin FldA [bacterium endosymbiont of Pedicinus badii]|uniref:flavodoxin FldA n=1 Tax=bacterium endosymbiont of Pedicinus badii TaxID=1719126 RepID=UPI0009BA867E|nr:flavodoxin FldA [bacterium endosymbiont of Pedicinus badii]OQM34504.1 hypothetical protein AOQ89_00255 [bacterium endosymbiont of Pedicinus badii]
MKKKKIGIFFGSDTGNTEKIANIIKKFLGEEKTKIFDISETSQEDIENYEKIIFGIPTWYYGESQCDWEDFFPTLKKINFSNKKVAIFGCGDQEDYSEYFCDAMMEIYKIVKKNKARLVGKFSSTGYHFDSSKSLIDKNYFLGLAIDEDRQPELTEKRVKLWVEQIIEEMKKN